MQSTFIRWRGCVLPVLASALWGCGGEKPADATDARRVSITAGIAAQRAVEVIDESVGCIATRTSPRVAASLGLVGITVAQAALGFGTGFKANGPLAITIIGGMISSTVLTLLVVPALYSLSEHGLARLRQRGASASPVSAGSA